MIKFTVLLLSFAQSITLSRKKIIFYTSGDQKKQVNAAYLIGSYAVSVARSSALPLFCSVIKEKTHHDWASVVFPRYWISTWHQRRCTVCCCREIPPISHSGKNSSAHLVSIDSRQIQWLKLLICCRDASFGTCMYNLNILDCLRAVNKVFLL